MQIYQEDDHGCIGCMIRSMEPTSQGNLSGFALLSTGNVSAVCARSGAIRKRGDATGGRNAVGAVEQRDENGEL